MNNLSRGARGTIERFGCTNSSRLKFLHNDHLRRWKIPSSSPRRGLVKNSRSPTRRTHRNSVSQRIRQVKREEPDERNASRWGKKPAAKVKFKVDLLSRQRDRAVCGAKRERKKKKVSRRKRCERDRVWSIKRAFPDSVSPEEEVFGSYRRRQIRSANRAIKKGRRTSSLREERVRKRRIVTLHRLLANRAARYSRARDPKL